MRGALIITALWSAVVGAQSPASPSSQSLRNAPPPDWSLASIFPDAAAATRARVEADAALPQLSRWKGRLADPSALRAALDARSAARVRVQRLYLWANTRLVRDGADAAAGVDAEAASAASAKLDAATAWIEPELVALGDAKLAALAADARLAPYARALKLLRGRAGHVLQPEQETMVAGLPPVFRSAATTRDALFNVELPWPTVTVGGEQVRLTSGSMRRVLTSPDRAGRRTAWEAFAATQDAFKGTSAAMLSAYLAPLAWEARTRHWSSQAEMVTAADPMPPVAFTALGAEAQRAAAGPLARYAVLKARTFGVPALAGYDLAAPFVPDPRRFTIEQARALTLAAVAPLGRDYQDRLATGMAGRWLDWHPLPAKAPGGNTLFAAPDLPAYMAISFAGDARSLALYAHEWGHWMHWEYARTSGLPADAATPAVSSGDVAPFVHEMLVADGQVTAATSREARVAALTAAVEALRTSYYGVVAQARFDLAVRAAADRGDALTPDSLSALYCEAQKRYAPPGVAWEPRDCLGWVTEPYVYYDLYFYRYLLATSAAAWFAERIGAGDRAASEQLRAFLAAGASADTPTLLARAGFDATDPGAYAAMTRRVSRLVAALEKELPTPR